ncbi:MAG: sensor histidine kinase [Bacteroidetes bacterium]|nr:sensor histidine kinase [Bacteroidota bacterium]
MKRLIILFFISLNTFAQTSLIDSLIKETNKASIHDSVKIKLYGDIAWEFIGSDMNKALEFANKELELATKTKREADIAQSESDIGSIYNRKSSFDTALIHYNKALSIREKLKQDVKVAGIYTNIATVLMRQSKFEEALAINFKSLKIFEKVGDEVKQAISLGNIGNLYYELEQNKPAEQFYRKSLALARKTNHLMTIGNDLVNIGGLKFEYGVQFDKLVNAQELDSALIYFSEAETVLTTINATYNLAAVYNNIGRIYTIKQNHKKALDYYEKALKAREILEDKYGIGLSYINLAETERLLGNNTKCIDYLIKASDIFLSLKNYLNLKQAYAKLAEAYELKKDYPASLKYYQLLRVIKDSIYNEDNAKQMAEMQTKYDVEKKDLELAKNKAEIETKEKQAYIKNIIIIAIVVLMLLVAITGFLFYRKKQIEQQAKLDAEIASQKEIRTKAILEAEEKERRRIAQDLHDGVGQLLSAAKLNLSNLDSKITTQTEEQKLAMQNALSLVDDSVKEVRAVSHNMMPNTLIKLGLASAVREFITKLGNAPTLKVDLEIVGLDTRLDNQVETVLYRVIQEIVNNIIKHAKASQISMQLIRHETELNIMIEDNGVGFDTNQLDDFEGIGLKGIQTRIEFLNGSVHFDSSIGRGTTVIIDIPLV